MQTSLRTTNPAMLLPILCMLYKHPCCGHLRQDGGQITIGPLLPLEGTYNLVTLAAKLDSMLACKASITLPPHKAWCPTSICRKVGPAGPIVVSKGKGFERMFLRTESEGKFER